MTPIASALLPSAEEHTDHIYNPSGFSYFALDSLATVPGSDTKLIKWFNAMFYGQFPKGYPSHYEEVVEAGWSPERIVIGVWDCVDDGARMGL
jgi:hypothetical protein